MIIYAVLVLAVCLYGLMLPDYSLADSQEMAAVFNTVLILALPVSGFIIYSALKMMDARDHRHAMAAAGLIILSGLLPILMLLGIPIGTWVLVVLMKPDVRATFAEVARLAPDSAATPLRR